DLQSFRRLVGDDGQFRILLDAVRQVDQATIDTAGQRGLRQTGADRGRNLSHRNGLFNTADGTVRERNIRHRTDLRQPGPAGDVQTKKKCGRGRTFSWSTKAEPDLRISGFGASSSEHVSGSRCLVGAIGLEPTTPTMSRWCSNQ